MCNLGAIKTVMLICWRFIIYFCVSDVIDYTESKINDRSIFLKDLFDWNQN